MPSFLVKSATSFCHPRSLRKLLSMGLSWITMPCAAALNAIGDWSSVSLRMAARVAGNEPGGAHGFAVALTFPAINSALESLSFAPNAGLMFVVLVYFYFSLPETNGKTVEEIQDELDNQ